MDRSFGTLGREEASFEYRIEGDTGVLSIQSGASKGIIRSEDVVAAKEDESPGTHRIMAVLNSEDSASSTSKPRAKVESLQMTNLPQSFVKDHSRTRLPAHFHIPRYHDETPNVHIVISTHSGIGEARLFYEDVLKKVLDFLDYDGGSYSLHVTESEKSITNLSRTIFLPRANEGVAQTIILLSGDGGIVDIVNVLLSSPRSEFYVKPVIALLVLGTGNALASSTGLNRGSTKGLRTLFKGKPHSLPTFTATFSPGSECLVDEGRGTEPLPMSEKGLGVIHGAVVCSWALHASLVADSDTAEYRKYGSGRFQMAAKELLVPSDGSGPHVYQGKITIFRKDDRGCEDSVELDRRDHMYVLASLVSNLEETFKISPQSQPFDGQLRLVHFGAITSTEVMRIMGLAAQGGLHVRDDSVGYDDIDGMRIDFEEADGRWRKVCVDGKIIRVKESGWVEVRPGPWDVLDIIADLDA
ncbi:hypothetical protein MMC07_008176 [Pseudocyphellaria aurata]|nr:hypothetical protein [Pseudocyphellaria aurata]